MFPQLSTFLGLENQLTLPPPGTCIAVCDQERQPVPRPQGSFIQLHLLTLFLRAKHPCVFFSLTDNYTHLRVIAAKCGFGLQSYADSGQLKHLSGMTVADPIPTEGAADVSVSHSALPHPGAVLKDLALSLSEIRIKFPEKAPCVVVEDLSVLLDLGWDVHELFAMMRSLRSLVSDGTLVFYSTSAEDCESEEAVLSSFLFHFADWFLETSGLRSGSSSTIDGQLNIRIRNTTRPGVSVKTCHYKVQERRIQFFAPGTSSGIL
ncbi:hypothetical protein BV898_02253 [Hypsibius exemplaris]|uniref:Elongator complex protein 6 n=1 Tax=Hypsibius exemplaris TaxID=2072580 RepID=A0A1W0X8N7_HYPEX|nr:hypothetical protein BV898_02253 [Hypsibius exemplaris]